MKTKSKSKTDQKAESVRRAAISTEGKTGRVIFFGPSETITKLNLVGTEVSRQDVKDFAIEYVHRVTSSPKLDPIKEPITLMIEKWEIETLLSAGQPGECVSLKAMLAVETNGGYNSPHQTFVLMPCDQAGRVIVSNEGPNVGRERWPSSRNVQSVIEDGSIVSGVEKFLIEDLRI